MVPGSRGFSTLTQEELDVHLAQDTGRIDRALAAQQRQRAAGHAVGSQVEQRAVLLG